MRLAVGADGAGRAGRRDEVDRHQNSPSMVPSGWTRIASAAGVLRQPGHGHDVAGERDDEAGAGGGIDVADGEPEAGGPAQLGGDRR